MDWRPGKVGTFFKVESSSLPNIMKNGTLSLLTFRRITCTVMFSLHAFVVVIASVRMIMAMVMTFVIQLGGSINTYGLI